MIAANSKSQRRNEGEGRLEMPASHIMRLGVQQKYKIFSYDTEY
jgi:hypothetical protein